MERTNSSTLGLVRAKSDQLVESMVAALKSPQSSDHSANGGGTVESGGTLSRKSSRRGLGKNTHIRKSRSAQIEIHELSSGAALSRASSASLGLSFSFTGFTMPPDQIADTKPFSDDDDDDDYMIRKLPLLLLIIIINLPC